MTDKPDLRILVTTKSDTSFGHYLTAAAHVVYLNDQGVRSPMFEYRDDGIGEYADLALTAQLSDYERTITSTEFYGAGLAFEQPHSVKLTRAESMVKLLRRLERRLEKANEQLGSTDYAGMCARLAVAVGCKDRYPLGIYDRAQVFPTTGSHYKWMDTDALRSHLAKTVQEWMTKHGITIREAS